MYYYTSYLLFVLPAMIFVLIAQAMVNSSYKKYREIGSRSHKTGAQVASEILHANNVNDIEIHEVKGNLTDHYDSSKKAIKLSEGVYNGTSIAAIAIAAHESGHVIQDKEGYGFFKLRMSIVPITMFSSNIAIPIFLIGLFLGTTTGELFMKIGIALFGIAVVFQLITLPVEFNASSRALGLLSSRGILDNDEISGAKSMLNAAALTYVAALAASLGQLLRLLFMRNNRRR